MSDTDTDTTETVDETSADNSTSTAEAATVEAPAEVRDPAKLLSAYEAEKTKRKEAADALRELRTEFAEWVRSPGS